MAVNPDPKPGRWILPLVILGMIAFTYFFVRELPEASTDTTLVTGEDTTTTAANGEENGEETTTTEAEGESQLDADTQAYLDEIDEINSELQSQRTELTTVNTGFDADPREIEFSETMSRFEDVEEATQDLAERHSELTPPAGLETNHQNLQSAIELASASITEAISGLRSDDPGDRRRSAVNAYANAAADYDTEITNTRNAANALAAG